VARGISGGSVSQWLGRMGWKDRILRLAGVAAIVGVSVLVLWRADILFRDTSEDIETTDESGQRVVLQIRAADTSVETPNPRGLDVGVQEGKLAPNFEISNFDGERVQLADFRGRPVFLNFWATWCGPCRAEMPAIQAVLDQYEDQGLVVLAVDNGERFEPAHGFVEELGLDFTAFGLDPGQDVIDRYRVVAMPTSVFIDAEGVITQVHAGQATEQQMREFVLESIGSSVAER
jgi:thiol-disulfide isomerase/thioredoxin